MARYGDKNIGIDDSEFQRKAKALAKVWKIDEVEFINNQSRLLAREAGKFTLPFASFPDWHKGTSVGSKQDIEQGEWAIYYDLKRIFAPIGDGPALKESRKNKGGPVYRNGRIRFAGVAKGMADMRFWHRKNTGARGRTKKLDDNGAMLVGWSLFNQYYETQKRKAGIAKASFWKASMGFKGSQATTPKIKRHLSKASGVGRLVKANKGPEGLIKAKAEGIWNTNKFIPHLRRNRLKKALKRLEILAKKAGRKAKFKTT